MGGLFGKGRGRGGEWALVVTLWFLSGCAGEAGPTGGGGDVGGGGGAAGDGGVVTDGAVPGDTSRGGQADAAGGGDLGGGTDPGVDTPGAVDSGGGDSGSSRDVDAGAGSDADAGAPVDAGPLPVATGPVNGWILLDADLDAALATIDAGATLGVNHVQLSHDLIMNIEDVLPGADGADERVALLNAAIERAHERGMKAYVWAHEISGDPPNPAPCWGPDGAFWEQRAQAYRDGIARIPGIDGIILMFGSAPVPPWLAVCSCAWCDPFTLGGPWDKPPQAMKVQLIVEHVGGVIVGELGKELFVRTFIHEPVEVPWHTEGLSAVGGVPFVAMHKGEANDWQPYNPPDPDIGHIGDHAAVVELDLAGEYMGLSELPFVAPGYFRYRMQPVWAAGGIGAVARVQRGSHHALGTPNEVNLRAVAAWTLDPTVGLDDVWSGAVSAMYGLAPGSEAAARLRRILEHTFPVRLKSHYALGIWALEKSSDVPSDTKMEELNDRGNLPEWDADWQPVWDAVSQPTRQSVEWMWQEGTEAVELAAGDLADLDAVEGLTEEARTDLARRLLHQWWAARAWRAVDLLLFGRKAATKAPDDAELRAWVRWAHGELGVVADGMLEAGLGGVSVASPARLKALQAATASIVPQDVEAAKPTVELFSPLEPDTTGEAVTLRFTVLREADVTLEWGTELPDYGHTIAVGPMSPGEERTVTLEDAPEHARLVARVRALEAGADRRGGDFWIFTK